MGLPRARFLPFCHSSYIVTIAPNATFSLKARTCGSYGAMVADSQRAVLKSRATWLRARAGNNSFYVTNTPPFSLQEL